MTIPEGNHASNIIRTRMNNCKSLFYSTTHSSSSSKWMPWECGYFDGKKGKSAILPLTYSGIDSYEGQEYLGIYPYITEDRPKNQSKKILYVNESPEIYCTFDSWLTGRKPSKH